MRHASETERAVRRFAALLCVLLGCAESADSVEPVKVSIDADVVVRANTSSVDVVVEALLHPEQGDRGESWTILEQRVFVANPTMDDSWPWTFRIESDDQHARYGVTVTARDGSDAVVAQARAIRTLAQARRAGLRVHFETACFRATELCGEGLTCAAGQCVDASDPSAVSAANATSPHDQIGTETSDPPDGIARAGATCSIDGARICSDRELGVPLLCEEGTWRAQQPCAEHKLCESSQGPHRGECRAIVGQCVDRPLDVPFCDGEVLRVCADLFEFKLLPCAEHERCAMVNGDAVCACVPGFVQVAGSGRCEPAPPREQD